MWSSPLDAAISPKKKKKKDTPKHTRKSGRQESGEMVKPKPFGPSKIVMNYGTRNVHISSTVIQSNWRRGVRG